MKNTLMIALLGIVLMASCGPKETVEQNQPPSIHAEILEGMPPLFFMKDTTILLESCTEVQKTAKNCENEDYVYTTYDPGADLITMQIVDRQADKYDILSNVVCVEEDVMMVRGYEPIEEPVKSSFWGDGFGGWLLKALGVLLLLGLLALLLIGLIGLGRRLMNWTNATLIPQTSGGGGSGGNGGNEVVHQDQPQPTAGTIVPEGMALVPNEATYLPPLVPGQKRKFKEKRAKQ